MRYLNLVILTSFMILVACNNQAEKRSENLTASVPSQASTLIQPEQFEKLMKEENTVILDVRTEREVQRGIIPGATLIDFSSPNFAKDISNLDKDKVYLVYCASGGRSNSTQKMMNKEGFTQVYDLKGGIRAWTRAGKATIVPEN